MIDSQTQIRWLAAVLVMLVVGIGPLVAGLAFSEEPKEFTVYDTRDSPAIVTRLQKVVVAKLNENAIFLVGTQGPGCESDIDGCPQLDEDVVEVPVSADARIGDIMAGLGNTYGLSISAAPNGSRTALLPGQSFSVRAALTTGVLLLIGTLLAVTTLAGRRPAPVPPQPDSSGRPQDYPPYGNTAYGNTTSTVAPPDLAPPPPPPPPKPVVRLEELPGIHDIARAHGATATARSHIDDAGGYVALGDVLVWATPVAPGGAITAYPDDDVDVAAAARSAPLIPPQYGGFHP